MVTMICKNNIAIVTGIISRLLVIDIDGEECIKLFYEMVQNRLSDNLQREIVNTLAVRTGSGEGLQIYLRFNIEEKENPPNFFFTPTT